MNTLVWRVLATIRNAWRALTSMGTALALLVLLALGAIPGAMLPQRALNAAKVDEYLDKHSIIGPWLDKVQAFDVFSSFWFTAIYVLLFVSLIGCLTPRIIEHAKALRAQPVPVPRNLSRLPKHSGRRVAGDRQAVAAAFTGQLRGWRKVTRENGETTEISAEKGYLREFGNLVFHFSLVGLLVSFAVGKLFGYEGNVIVLADGGPGFCSSSPAAFDSFRAGNTVDGTNLDPICIRVKDFKATYLASGQPHSFESNISYQAGPDLQSDTWRSYRLAMNHPLRIDGNRVYLLGYGYAPTFTVQFPDGRKRSETIQWRPDSPTTMLSSGAIRIDPPAGTYPNPEQRRKNQIAVQGVFAPTEQLNGTLLSSSFPEMRKPAVAVNIYRGDTGLDSGRPQSIFELDRRMIEQKRLNQVARANMLPGQSVKLNDGTIVTFEGAVNFVNLQVSRDPAQQWVLVFAMTMMAGLLVSLVVKRRRIWARITEPGDDPRSTVNVEVGGLARTDSSGWGEEFERLCDRFYGSLEHVGSADGPDGGTERTAE